MNKSNLLIGAAIGYVLGARAGHERYEQIKDVADKARHNPRVQSVVDDVMAEATAAAQQATSTMSDKVADLVSRSDEPTR